MAGNAIIKINKEAKRLQRIHKTWPWKDCIRVASDNYNSGKIGSLPMKANSSLGRASRKHKRRPAAKKAKHRRHIGTAKPTAAARGTVSPAKLSGVSAGSLRSELKRRINTDIDKAVVRKFHATGKRIKRKIQKIITDKKAQLRKLI